MWSLLFFSPSNKNVKNSLACDKIIVILLQFTVYDPRCADVISYYIQVVYKRVSPTFLYLPRTALFYIQKKEFLENNRIYKPSIIT